MCCPGRAINARLRAARAAGFADALERISRGRCLFRGLIGEAGGGVSEDREVILDGVCDILSL